MDNQVRFKVLLIRYRDGICDQEELDELLDLLEKNPAMYRFIDENVAKDWKKQSKSENEIDNQFQMGKKSRGRWLATVAASLILLVAIGFYWFDSAGSNTLVYETGFGERKKIELPDGSTVELNANSRLEWNLDWERTGVRYVTLSGEAYFDVVKSASRKFNVDTRELVVRVLGTSFNVSHRRGNTEVYLKEGKVELDVPKQEDVLMEPGEKIRYNRLDEKMEVTSNETVNSAASWTTGVISYRRQLLKDIIIYLGDIYGIELVCHDEDLNNTMMDVGVPYMAWDMTKEALELSMGIKIISHQGKHYIQNIN